MQAEKSCQPCCRLAIKNGATFIARMRVGAAALYWRRFLGVLLLATIGLGFSASSLAAIDATWLKGQQNTDGSFGAPGASVATPSQATSETLALLAQLGIGADPAYIAGLGYLNQSTESNTEALSRRIIANLAAGNDNSALISEWLTHRNLDGGFGDAPGYSSSVLDTAIALHAANLASAIPATDLSQTIVYLLNSQGGDGGWADGNNASSVYLTALAMRALSYYRDQYTQVNSALLAGQQFLMSQRNADGLWGETHDSALALIALTQSLVDLGLVEQSFAALAAARLADGSWDGDAYSTALALQAQFAYDTRKTPAISASSAVSGYVLRAGTGEPVAGADVQLFGGVTLSVTTNASGYYLIPGVAAGSYTASASKSGYTTASVAVTVADGQTAVAGTLVLDIAPNVGLVRGQVFDGTDLVSLAGVTVSLSGLNNYSTMTGSTGTFELRSVVAGAYAVAFSKTGYQTVTGSVTVVGGQILSIQQSMMLSGAFVDTQPGNLSGRVLDAKTGVPIAGALLDIGGGYSATTDSNGSFVINSVPRGEYSAVLSAGGYQSQSYAINYPAGSSGAMGTLSLFPATATTTPTTVTLVGAVSDAVSGQPVVGATVAVPGSGLSAVTAANGGFTLSGITATSFSVEVSATGYQTAVYSVQASGFGEVHAGLQVTPTSATTSTTTLHGVVSDVASGSPVPGATVQIANTALTATSATDGSYSLGGIDTLNFTVSVSASGYRTDSRDIQIASHGDYTLNIPMQAALGQLFEVGAVNARQASAGSNSDILFDVTVKNLASADQSTLVVGEIVDAAGKSVAVVEPYIPGTQILASDFSFVANESKTLTFKWNTEQNPAGTYRMLVRAIEPGSITRAVPWGNVLAENSGYTLITDNSAISGSLLLLPPLTQAGSSNPVLLSARIRNNGNTELAAGDYRLTITHPDTGATLYSTTVTGVPLAIGESADQSFGSWVPTAAGNLNVVVTAMTSGVGGTIEGRLYVGDRATGTFTVDRNVVPEGTQTVRGNLAIQGVDTTQGTVTDPLFALVKTAVSRGGVYTGREAVAWDRRNQCLGCHIQTQSLMGMASSINKADINLDQTKFLYNSVASSQQEGGALRISHPQHTKVQTSLGLWSLTAWQDKQFSFRTKYRAAKHLFDQKTRSGNYTYWTQDHMAAYWVYYDTVTALTTRGITDLLDSAATIDHTKVTDYSVTSGIALGSANDPTDVATGPDGALYVLVYNSATARGSVLRVDPVTQAITTVVANTGSVRHGIAVAPDGTIFVTGYQKVLRFNTDGSQQVLRQTTEAKYFVGITIGPDGLLYISDHGNNRILRMGLDGSNQQVFATSPLFNNPYGLKFNSTGDLLVANFNGNNLLRVKPDGTVSVFADGFAYRPLMLALDANGDVIVSTYQFNLTGQNTPGGLARVTPDGLIEPINHGTTNWGVLNDNGTLYYLDRTNKRIRQLVYSSFNFAKLDELRNELPRVARWVLARYRDNTSFNIVQAQRLNILAEVRPYLSDTTLQANVDTAIAYIANVLRARQRADGGWGRNTGWSSDSLMTAMVGLALDRTNPSADDPMVRKAVTLLLNRQAANGSWSSENGIFTTRLAATSFVMTYLPKALDRLGGMDLDVHLTLKDNVQLTNPTVAPKSVTALASGELDYLWNLKGVTSAGQDIGFDLSLTNLQLNETRPAASAAYLEFANSFVNSTERLDLNIPTVRAASEMTIDVGTDKSTYGANENVSIAPLVSNGGPTMASGNVYLTVRASGSTTALADLPPIAVTDLTSGQQLNLSALWNTGGTYVGGYEVLAILKDLQGRELSRAVAPFSIVAPAISVTTSVATDKPLYGGWDTVQISGRVTNLAQNNILPASLVDIIVRDPNNTEVYRNRASLSELAPGALRTLPFTMALVDATSGIYTVELQLLKAFDHTLLSTSNTTFEVQWTAAQALAGKVTVNPQRVAWGVSAQCAFTTTNRSITTLSGVDLVYRLIDLQAGTVISDETQTLASLVGGVSNQYTRSIDTGPLGVGGYACQLLATVGGEQRVLAYNGFQVYDPVKLDAQLKLGSKGRVLILLDPSSGGGSKCPDLKQIGMSTSFASLPANASVQVSVLDNNGKVIEQENASLATMSGPVNEQPGNNGDDLTIADFNTTGLNLLLSEYHSSNGSVPNKHSVVADVTVDGNVVLSLNSGPLPTNCGQRVAVGETYSNFNIDETMFASAANADPFGPDLAPDLVSQRAYLEALLTRAGWAYTIVESAEDFRVKLNSGDYSIYLLLNEYEKLDETAQKALREAVFRRDGLVVAGGHDARNVHHPKLTEALGLQPQGVYPDATGADTVPLLPADQLLWPVGGTGFTILDKVGRSALQGAIGIANYRRPPDATGEPAAVMHHDFGAGKTVTMGFDWAAEATAEGQFNNYLAQWLIKALEHVSPAVVDTTAGHVVPMTLTVQNQGIQALTRVTVNLPVGATVADAGLAKVNNTSLTWDFTLLDGQTIDLDFWVKLPETVGTITVAGEVSAVNPSNKYHVYATPTFDVNVLAPVMMNSVQDAVGQLLTIGVGDANAVNRAQDALTRAQAAWPGDPSTALFEGLKATDALADAGTAVEVATVRQMLDHWLWMVARQLP